MVPDKATAAGPRRTPGETLFTAASANRALVLVRRIVADLVSRYHELLELKQHREDLRQTPASQELQNEVQDRIARCVADINRHHQELTDIGCVVKDFDTGLIDFPALHHGRRVWLCWKLGEARVAHWHELHEGYAGRQAVDDGFDGERGAA